MNESFSIISHWFCKSRSVKIRKHGLTGLLPHTESLKFVPSYCTDPNRKWSKFPYMSRTKSCTWLLRDCTGLLPHIESLKIVPSYCTDPNRKWSKFPYMSRTKSCIWLLRDCYLLAL
ncbi:hypothetical protein ACJW30_11G132200 [Castanea mollissima]